jgi:hypothetical protein
MGALIEPAGKSTTANSVPRYSKAFQAKEWQNCRSCVQENAISIRQWADRPCWSIRRELRWSSRAGRVEILVWCCLESCGRIGWGTRHPPGTLVASVKEAGDPIVGAAQNANGSEGGEINVMLGG